MWLSTRDQKAALTFIREAYAIRDLERFVTFVLAALPGLVRSEVTSYNEIDLRHGRSKNWVVPAQPPERHEAWLHVMHEHPVLRRYQQVGGEKVLRMSDFLSPRQLRSTALYSEHYGPIGGVEDCMPILWGNAENANSIGVHRLARFTEAEQSLMQSVRPHLIQAHANAMAISKLTRDVVRLGKAVELVNCAVLILKQDRTIDFATGLARRWLSDYFSMSNAADRLPEALDLWVRQHEAAIRETLRLPRPRDPLVIERASKRLVVRLLSGDRETAIILEEQGTLIYPESLEPLSLTRREREVLAHIANGRSAAEVARTLGIGARTVETHIFHICERLGVSSRAGAAARAFQASRIASLQQEKENDAEPPSTAVRTLLRGEGPPS